MASSSTHVNIKVGYRNRRAIPTNYQSITIPAETIIGVYPVDSTLSTDYLGNSTDYIYASVVLVNEDPTGETTEYITTKLGPQSTPLIQPPSAIKALIVA